MTIPATNMRRTNVTDVPRVYTNSVTTRQLDIVASYVRTRGHTERASYEWEALSPADRAFWRNDIAKALRAAGISIVSG